MQLISSAFENKQPVPQKYTCEGDDVNPPLRILDVPQAAESLVLIVDDPDAPAGTWVHWTVWNIDPTTVQIPEDSVPEGAEQGMTNFGSQGYGGPCPPEGDGQHRYFFRLYAIGDMLDISPESERKDIDRAMDGKILEEAELMGVYERE